MFKKNEFTELEITDVTAEGNGVGRADGIIIFVPNTAVGDRIRAKIVKVTKNYCYGIVDELLEKSHDRVQPDCEVYKTCGGCCFRHISYEAETALKEKIVRDAIERIGKVTTAEFEPILPCYPCEAYRNKAQYPVAELNGKIVCGFYSKRSHRVVPFTKCRLQPKEFGHITDTITEFLTERKISAYSEITHKGLVRHIYLRKGFHSGEVMVCLVVTKDISAKLKGLVHLLIEKFPYITNISLNINSSATNVILGKRVITLYGKDTITDIMCGNKIELSPLSFYQVNTLQAEKLYGIAKEYAELKGNETLLDLYCGAGTIGLSMAGSVKKLVGVEIVPEAVENAKHNAELNNIKNAEFFCGDAGEIASKLNKKPDVIIIDPPRKGCDMATLDTIINISPEKVVMISCNPSTAGRDCNYFQQNGYKVRKVRAVDLFPRTSHVECVVLMSRVNPKK